MTGTGKSKEWYRDAADLAWKEYFRKERDGSAWVNFSHVSQKLLDTCGAIYRRKCTTTDQQIIRAYYDRKWGDDIFAVEDFSERTGIPVDGCWHAIRRVRRMLMIRMELLEREQRERTEQRRNDVE